MIKFEKEWTGGFENALFGMRNALESWDKADTKEYIIPYTGKPLETQGHKVMRYIGDYALCVEIGPNDLGRAQALIRAGGSHSKFMRQIFVNVQLTAPMTWWWDMDTYKVATVKNSTSRMHKIGTRLLKPEDFSWDDQHGIPKITPYRLDMLKHLNDLIEKYHYYMDNGNTWSAKQIWRELVLDIPDSYNFTAMWSANYEVLKAISKDRKNHKQWEFDTFIRFCESLPYGKELIFV
jgi:hypothetical protein